MPLKLTVQQMHQYMSYREPYFHMYEQEVKSVDEEVLIDNATYDQLKRCDLRDIISTFGMSENNPGGDDILAYITDTLKAVQEGYQIATFYDPDTTNALVVGFKEDQLEITGGDVWLKQA